MKQHIYIQQKITHKLKARVREIAQNSLQSVKEIENTKKMLRDMEDRLKRLNMYLTEV